MAEVVEFSVTDMGAFIRKRHHEAPKIVRVGCRSHFDSAAAQDRVDVMSVIGGFHWSGFKTRWTGFDW